MRNLVRSQTHCTAYIILIEKPLGGILTADGGIFKVKLGSLLRVQINLRVSSRNDLESSPSGMLVSGIA